MKKRLVAVALGACGAVVAACQVLAGIGYVDKDTDRIEPLPDGTTPDGAPAPPDPCTHVRPPPEVKDDDRDKKEPGFYLALKRATIGTPNGVVNGFDLDGVCTCEKRPNTVADGGSTCKPKKGSDCDHDGGIDNRGATLFNELAFGTDIDSRSDVNTSIENGKGGLLIYIEGYNGLANDLEVNSGAMRSHGIVDGSGCGTDIGDTPGRYKPGWCGKDRWTYPRDLVLSGTKIPNPLARGYVTDGTLVFQSNARVSLLFGTTTISFASPLTAGKLAKVDGKWTFKGTMSGRLATADLLRAIDSFSDPFNKNPLNDGGKRRFCNSEVFPTFVQGPVCDAVDISASSAFDLKGSPCDAISSAVAFEAEQADVGERLDEDEPGDSCDPDASVFKCPP